MSTRLADVAKQAGVSEATVSRVLNAKPGVSDSTRQAVLVALDVLGYERPTQLRGDRGRLVGLMLPELQNPIFPAFADVVGSALAQGGYTPVLCTLTAGAISEAEYIDLLLRHQVSGVIFAGGLYTQADAPHDHYTRLRELRMPTVFVNAPYADLGFPCVSCDDAFAAEIAVGHLLSLGHSRIGLVLGPTDHVPSRRKLAAIRAMARRDGFSFDDSHVAHSLYSLEGAQTAAARLIASGITGIVCASDPMALGAIRAARRAGLRVPADLSIVGFDDSALMTSIDPPLTTVRQPIEAMGRTAIELLLGQIAGSAVPRDELMFEPELVVRASTGPVAPRS
jgi:DNA-binding LacI/PurR family transcriptional regulator